MSAAVPPASVPRHVAIIMDGNGRWARQRKLPRLKGHERGAESVRSAIRSCRDAGIQYLTLYAFSVENWSRPKAEINGLMRLLRTFLRDRAQELHDDHVRLRVTGRMQDLPAAVQKALNRVMADTAAYERGTLILALSYGGRAELVDATRRIAAEVKAGTLAPDAIDEQTIADHLYLPDVPDPDLLIRTSGEMRLSNFLLWQLSYSELYVTDVLWPDFRDDEFQRALAAYAGRHRRYGGLA
ncbi:MAG: isoprenyl transferase [Verrucomicrobia bacterium]|jgi:undecaprenyl diphosphate synthase|nr:isoprenyl transferase [Verrucomicrobiota bacterium]MBT7065566.1 isoprenyl transferase [Verrucomicrobiota bacterium]MBT7701086.1 isoprenyl transferase [Verrucomicrobiota bacterium]